MKSISLSLLPFFFILGFSTSAIAQKMSWWEYTYQIENGGKEYKAGPFPTKENCNYTRNWAISQGWIVNECEKIK